MTDSKTLMAAAEKAGWVKVRQSGSHAIFKHASRPDTVSIPIRNLNPGLAKEIRLKLKRGDTKDTLGRMGKELAAPKVAPTVTEPTPEVEALRKQLSEVETQLRAQAANSSRAIAELNVTKERLTEANSTIEVLQGRLTKTPVESPSISENIDGLELPSDFDERPLWSRNLLVARLRMKPSPTQMEVSKQALGMNYSVISFFELGKRVIPSEQQWITLAEYYKTSVEALKGKEPLKLRAMRFPQPTPEPTPAPAPEPEPEPVKPIVSKVENVCVSPNKQVLKERVDELLARLSDDQVKKLARMLEALLPMVVLE